MKIRIYSFGTPESLDLRCILEGMYRKVGEVKNVDFPDDNSIELTIETSATAEWEYGLHQMVRISPRYDDGSPKTSHVMVEIDGKSREEIVASYNFYPNMVAENYIVGKRNNVMAVLNGRPLGMKMKMNMASLDGVFA